MGNLSNWARKEIELACKNEDEYGRGCYESALKAYESLLGDGHSGFSFNCTKWILIRLMNSLPLSSIKEEDFKDAVVSHMEDKDSYQCPRMSSLFKDIDLKGNITYHDVNRSYCINIDNEDDTFGCFLDKVVDYLYPISMPYSPTIEKFKVYVRQFVKGNVEYMGVIKVTTPKGETIPVNGWLFKSIDNGPCFRITREEFEKAWEK